MPIIHTSLFHLLIPLGLFVIICGVFTLKGGFRSVLKFYGITSSKNKKTSELIRKKLGSYFIFSGILTALAGVSAPAIFGYRLSLGLLTTAVYMIVISAAGIHTGKKIGNENRNLSSHKIS
jgi:predicted transporter